MEKDKFLNNKESSVNIKLVDEGGNKPNPIVDRPHFEFNDLKKARKNMVILS